MHTHNVLNALLAWLILQEDVSLNRWLAAILISIGVFLVSLTKPSSPDKPPRNVLLFFLPLGLSLPKFWLGVIIYFFLPNRDCVQII